MKKNSTLTILFLLLIQPIPIRLYSQEKTKIYPSVSLQYLRDTDDKRLLKATITYSDTNSIILPLASVEMLFYNNAGGKELITKAVTGSDGIAIAEISDGIKLKTGSDGMWAFSSEYPGNDTVEAASSTVSVRDLRMVMTTSEVDSIKTLAVNAFTKEGTREVPVSGEVVKIYVPRMFSMLTIAELTLDAEGSASVEFPSGIPGDHDGNIVVLARIEENATYGTVEKRDTLNWGVPVDYNVPVTHRALWTSIAPRWMIYTLTVLLAGVWGHYLYAIISLIRIKINADRKKAKEEYRL